MENKSLKSFKDLNVWQKASELAVLVYKITEKFPHSETYGIINQMRRAVISISSNLAEGFKRSHRKEKLQFYNVAYGSAAELESQIEISNKLQFLSEKDYQKLIEAVTEVSKMINGLIKSLNSKSYILNSDCNGQSLVEIMVAIGIGAILIGGATAIIVPILRSNLETRNVQIANSLTQEYLDNLQSLAESNWQIIYTPPSAKGPSSQFYLAPTSTTFMFVSGTTSTVVEGRTFTRYFSVENVSRKLCGADEITTDATTTCTSGPGSVGITDDPSTQKITATVSWPEGRLISKTQYLTRSVNKVFRQTDWSGGSGQEGPITSENNEFATSTDINYGSSASTVSAGYNSPTTLANDNSIGVVAWTNPSNAGASDNSYATAIPSGTQTTYYLKTTNFGFGIPSGATVSGIEASVERKADAVSDGNDSYTELLLHMDSNWSDSSSNNYSPTTYSTPLIDTTTKKFGAGSGKPNSTGYVTYPDSEDWDFQSGDFTIDFWLRSIDGSGGNGGIINRAAGYGWGADCPWMIVLGASTVEFYAKDSSLANMFGAGTLSFGTFSTTQFDHFALVRNGSTWKAYKNGTLVSSYTNSNALYNAPVHPLSIFNYANQINNLYLDEVRISKGIARWTANFTPPTVAYIGIGSAQDNAVKIVKSNGAIGTTNKASVSTWPTSDAVATYGGSSDLWSETWTSSDINNSNFGVAVSASSTDSTVNIDQIQLKVYYTTSGAAGSIIIQGF